MKMSDEWTAGYSAHRSGASIDLCPFPQAAGRKFEDWVDGWNASYNDSQDRSA